MCKAFSGVATRGKVYWKLAMDSHENIKDEFNLDDSGDKLVPFEISPKNENYLKPDEWVFKFDDGCPDWWKQSNEKMCWESFRKWKRNTYAKIRVKKKIVHPFVVKPPKRITKTHIKLLKEWDSVRASVWDSVRASVRDSVRDSVGASVWASVRDSVGASVWDSVWDSVGDSVWAYAGSFFRLPRKEWKYTKNIRCKGYPFESCVKLWEMGLVPSLDGKIWRLHGGKNAKVLFEISKEELMKK